MATGWNIRASAAVAACVIGLAAIAHAADDTARFYGTWETSFPYNGQTVVMVSGHDARGFKNYLRSPSGLTPAGDGGFSAANGRYSAGAARPNDLEPTGSSTTIRSSAPTRPGTCDLAAAKCAGPPGRPSNPRRPARRRGPWRPLTNASTIAPSPPSIARTTTPRGGNSWPEHNRATPRHKPASARCCSGI